MGRINKGIFMRGIKARLIFWICILFILIGVLICFPLSILLPKKISSQILKRDIKIAEYISREASDLLLIDDKLAINLLLHDHMEDLEDAKYIFIQNRDGRIISHTFDKGFPKDLININRPNSRQPYKVKKFIAQGREFYDIAIPIFEGDLGSLHLGVSLESGKKEIAEIARINYYVISIIFVGLGIGILIFLILGIIFSNRIINLKKFATKIGSGDLKARIDIKAKDEIGSLASAFNEMVTNLRQKIEEVKRLGTLEERNRIAIELHDGLAQSLADIIKRIELAQKLFAKDPRRALDELNQLKENTRDVLQKSRQAIFDLKSSSSDGIDLSAHLSRYIKDFNKRNEIQVDLKIIGKMQDLLPQAERSIFCIVSEALTNVKKHSQAKTACVRLEMNDGQLTLTVEDGGKGFNLDETLSGLQNERKLGLHSMRERARLLGGALDIDTAPKRGTKILVNVPIENIINNDQEIGKRGSE